LNSFIARATKEGLTDASLFAIWELSAALEEVNVSKAVANCNVSVASEWIIRCGTRLYAKGHNAWPLIGCRKRITGGGPLYKGEVGLCRERWEFWKLRFSEVKDEVDEDAAKMAEQAISAMAEVEKLMGKRDMNLK
jgi:uncharacterized protein DUF3632